MMDEHQCFGCQRRIADYEPHIHLTLDEWAERQGEEPTGLGDMFSLVFCEQCVQATDAGWQTEAHRVEKGAR